MWFSRRKKEIQGRITFREGVGPSEPSYGSEGTGCVGEGSPGMVGGAECEWRRSRRHPSGGRAPGPPSGLGIPIRGMALELCALFTKTGETGQRQVGGAYPRGLCDDGQGHGFWDWPHTPGDVWPWAKALYLFVPLCSGLKNQG